MNIFPWRRDPDLSPASLPTHGRVPRICIKAVCLLHRYRLVAFHLPRRDRKSDSCYYFDGKKTQWKPPQGWPHQKSNGPEEIVHRSGAVSASESRRPAAQEHLKPPNHEVRRADDKAQAHVHVCRVCARDIWPILAVEFRCCKARGCQLPSSSWIAGRTGARSLSAFRQPSIFRERICKIRAGLLAW